MLRAGRATPGAECRARSRSENGRGQEEWCNEPHRDGQLPISPPSNEFTYIKVIDHTVPVPGTAISVCEAVYGVGFTSFLSDG